MPTYDYQCTKCGHRFELFQPMSQAPKKSCPQCRGKIKRLISGGSGVIFKGSGFYATDYKKSASTPAEKKKPGPSCQGCPADCPQAEKPKTTKE